MGIPIRDAETAITTSIADYRDETHARDILALMEEYARDPFGGGEPLSDFCRAHLVQRLAEFPGAFSVLAYRENRAVGLVNCFTGFSTFLCKPLVNIHDVIVSKNARGAGVCTQMLELVAKEAKKRGCCKLTLEVLEKNLPAQAAYRKSGFRPYALDEAMGQAAFWQRYL
ncbi:GNAT family N-acetyltransferase [Microbulbifer thermotolerans]|uniref:GNAT family N-acetyltransferase n=1 Tax=Microbulbifer thermotolerans TaxID=252514 RepID=A0A143HJP7_MICTH|nr:GNAT family N-acetyltransferase [Microbulbifer thermotolerans]AMX01954.1 GNAT family acetyltransferase [Microbulbifer thermotolerans]MCX2783190.1 GNAT family N-acetyltransferase [Microbulbifer thermotolerans]MCX2794208.1 GNAT family N-acetyltransferase [Microbulbifer thermotolerans]MCX2800770.1 GNAT family N-acetyltransferase [Microbulbifer thermotolerans]MCX2829969.1 GNAT family N-acetyltransferase [Microbulbifer thermotolerans]